MKKFILSLFFVSFCLANGEPIPTYNSSQAATLDIQPERKIDLSRSGLINPVQFTVDSKYIYVADDFARGIYKFDPEGNLVTKVERINNEPFTPRGIAQDSTYLYVITPELGLFKLSKELDLNNYYPISVNNETTYFNDPRGICLDQYNELYVTDSGWDSVFKLNLLGRIEWKQGYYGQSKASLLNPVDVCLDKFSYIYVADNGSKSIKIFSGDDLAGTLTGFNDLHGICSGAEHIFGCDLTGQSVFVFNGQQLETKITDFNGQAFTPQDVFYFQDKLYILDPVTRQILVYAVK